MLPAGKRRPYTASWDGGCGADRSTGGDTVGDGTYLLTVDGYGVTEEKFLLLLRDQKAAASHYFWTQYQVQPDAGFWTAAVNGEMPLAYAKGRALDALVTAKITLILAAERGILAYAWATEGCDLHNGS